MHRPANNLRKTFGLKKFRRGRFRPHDKASRTTFLDDFLKRPVNTIHGQKIPIKVKKPLLPKRFKERSELNHLRGTRFLEDKVLFNQRNHVKSPLLTFFKDVSTTGVPGTVENKLHSSSPGEYNSNFAIVIASCVVPVFLMLVILVFSLISALKFVCSKINFKDAKKRLESERAPLLPVHLDKDNAFGKNAQWKCDFNRGSERDGKASGEASVTTDSFEIPMYDPGYAFRAKNIEKLSIQSNQNLMIPGDVWVTGGNDLIDASVSLPVSLTGVEDGEHYASCYTSGNFKKGENPRVEFESTTTDSTSETNSESESERYLSASEEFEDISLEVFLLQSFSKRRRTPVFNANDYSTEEDSAPSLSASRKISRAMKYPDRGSGTAFQTKQLNEHSDVADVFR